MINDSCTYLSGGSESKDGGIPIVLGINIGAGGVSIHTLTCIYTLSSAVVSYTVI